jgi:hypothetical protein
MINEKLLIKPPKSNNFQFKSNKGVDNEQRKN